MDVLILKKDIAPVDEEINELTHRYAEEGKSVLVFYDTMEMGKTFRRLQSRGVGLADSRILTLQECGTKFGEVIALDDWGKNQTSAIGINSDIAKAEEKSKEIISIEESFEEKKEVDIILVRFNNEAVENKCIENIKRNTTWPYRITEYDNYPKNMGLSHIWNSLIKKSPCEYICLLNTDAFVTPNWLEEMMRGFKENNVVAVGASSNFAKGEQGNHTLDECSGYVAKYKELTTLSGFCMLIKKDVKWEFPKEVPFYGGEACWCVEARRNGYKLLWAKGAFVEHLGESSAKKEGNYEELVAEGRRKKALWLAKTSPVLFTTYNRLDYTKKSLPALIKSTTGKIIVIDNGSTDGTVKYLKSLKSQKLQLILNKENQGIKGAMNMFFQLTDGEEYVGKVDNDTVVPPNWFASEIVRMLECEIDIMQCKHPLLESPYDSFDEFMQSLKPTKNPHVFEAHTVGGSAVAINRVKINGKLYDSMHILHSWYEYQKGHPELKKAFCDDVEVKLLDMKGHNQPDYGKYKEYYKETTRLKEEQEAVVVANKLNIGSGHKPLEGYVNMDIHDYAVDGYKTDVIRNILQGIPFDSNKFEEVYTSHFMEHVRTGDDVYFVLHEIWRVLKNGGKFIIRVPHSDTPYAFYPDHLSYWNEEVIKAIVSDPFQHSKQLCYKYEIEEMGRKGIELQVTLIAKK